MWYASEWHTSISAVAHFIGGCLSIFGETLSAMIQEHIMAFFLAALLFAVACGLCLLLTRVAKKGVEH